MFHLFRQYCVVIRLVSELFIYLFSSIIRGLSFYIIYFVVTHVVSTLICNFYSKTSLSLFRFFFVVSIDFFLIFILTGLIC